MNIVRCSS